MSSTAIVIGLIGAWAVLAPIYYLLIRGATRELPPPATTVHSQEVTDD
jgi:hypothetical protein